MTLKRIKGLRFGILSPSEIRKMSVCEIIMPDTYDEDGFPIDLGLMSQRLGVIDPGLKCKTCGGRMVECPGHFGHIELAYPVIHIGFVKKIHKILSATCRACGRVLLDDEERRRFSEDFERIRATGGDVEDFENVVKEVFRAATMKHECPFCGERQPRIRFEKPASYYEIDDDGGERRLMPTDVRARLERIPDEDVRLLGIDAENARPEWMVLTVLPVPPVTARPSITLETGQRSEDDLTHKLVDILRINQRLIQNKDAGAPQLIIESLWELLQYHVATFLDNEIPGVPPARHRSGRPLKGIAQRLKGKEGRFRGSLSGKRVNFSARTVISPDPNISIDEVGVPEMIAKELTVTVYVTPRNIEEMRETVRRGPRHPGANYVRRPDGKKLKVTEKNCETLASEIDVGWKVERHLRDGDIVLFNRQPSLHRLSIMAHYVKVMPGRTFRLNPAVCVSGDTHVILDGMKVRMKDLKTLWDAGIRDIEVLTCNWRTRRIERSRIVAVHCINPKEFGLRCFAIRTESGKMLKVTEDHPFYTSRGVIAASALKVGDEVACYPVDLPEIEFSEQIILDEHDLMRFADAPRIVRALSARGLLPLKAAPQNIKRIIIIARMLGHMFGDGHISENSADIRFSGEEEDLERIKEDLRALGFDVRCRMEKNTMRIRCQPLGVLLAALGAPLGNKQSRRVPDWLFSMPLAVKRAFIAAYFGSELPAPPMQGEKRSTFIIMKGGIAFAEDMKRLLKDFGVKVADVRVDRRREITILKLSSDRESMLNLCGRIGYEYASAKDNAARHMFFCLAERGVAAIVRRKVAGKVAGSACVSPRRAASSPANAGIVWEKIVSIEACELERAYDITTESDNHNFFALNILTGNCPPYNADFDGDEMNLHVLQTEEARAEAKILMEVQENIISPRFGRPIIGGLHDHITGMFMLTRAFKRFSKEEMLRLLRGIEITDLPPPAGHDEDGKPFWTGKQIFSVILPSDLNARFRAKFCDKCYERGESCKEEECERDAFVIIKNGVLLRGVIDERALGSFKGELIERIYKKHGASAAKDFVNKFTKLAINYITQHGFSYGINDSDLPKEGKDYIREEILREAISRVNSLQEAYESGELEPLPGRTEEETLELLVMQELGSARDGAGEVASKYLDIENPAVLMARSGARGSMLNLTQMSACVGQQSIRGERIKRGYQNRTLPHFKKGDLSAEAHGFVKSSFKDGLTPIEYFFHAAGGREALVDTAVRTSQSGYFQRRLINALQDLSVRYDGTTRDARGIIVQFNYGDDGVDPSKSYFERYFDEIIEEELEKKAAVRDDEEQAVRDEEYEMMRW